MDVTIYEFSVITSCLLCYSNDEDLFEIRGDKGNELNVEKALLKHFWFKSEDLEERQQICLGCWTKLNNFYQFYLEVEDIYKSELEDDEDSLIKEEPTSIPILSVDDETNFGTIQFTQNYDEDFILPDEIVSQGSEIETVTDCSKNEKHIKIKGPKEIEIEDEIIKEHCPLNCDLCNQQFQNFNQIKKHFRSDHNKQGYVVCCGRKFIKRIRLSEHVAKFFDPDAYKCETCNKSYANSQSLKLHVMTAHEIEENRPYQCDKCDKTFSKQYILNVHQVSHTEKTVKCEMCDKVFANRTLMKSHFKIKHTKQEDFICDLCAKSFKVKSIFDKHRKEHEESFQAKVQCNICDAWLKNTSSLRKHMQRHNGQVHFCDICGKKTPNKLALKSHKDYMHKTEKLHKCSYCDKSFKRAFTLREHLTTHTGDVLYHCQFCPKTFNSSANMLSHRKKVHPKQWSEIQKQKTGKLSNVDRDTL